MPILVQFFARPAADVLDWPGAQPGEERVERAGGNRAVRLDRLFVGACFCWHLLRHGPRPIVFPYAVM